MNNFEAASSNRIQGRFILSTNNVIKIFGRLKEVQNSLANQMLVHLLSSTATVQKNIAKVNKYQVFRATEKVQSMQLPFRI